MFNLWLFAVSLSAWFLASRGQTTPAPTYCDLDNCVIYTGNASDVTGYSLVLGYGTGGCTHCDLTSCDYSFSAPVGACECPSQGYCESVAALNTTSIYISTTTTTSTSCDVDNCASYTGNASDVSGWNSADQTGTGCVHCDPDSCDYSRPGLCSCPTKSHCEYLDAVGTVVAAAGAAALCCCICIILAVTLPTIAIIVGIVICCMQQNKTKTVVVTQTAPAGQTQT